MAFPDDVFPADDHCEICGAELGNEVVIQEFADGTFARLCSECYAGASFARGGDVPRGPLGVDEQSAGWSGPDTETGGDLDPMEMTKELLSPVADLITLQGEMQTALERLANSLERFAAGVVTDSIDKNATMENRVKSLESELEKTRNRLREAESLLVVTGGAAAAQGAAADTEATVAVAGQGTEPAEGEGPPPVFIPTPSTNVPAGAGNTDVAGTPAAAVAAAGEGDPWQIAPLESAEQATESLFDPDLTQEADTAGYWTTVGTPAASNAATEAAAPSAITPADVFSLEEVQWAQRYFNECPFTSRMRDVRRSLGKPRVNLSRVTGVDPRVLVTICWDIVWYQYLVELRREGFSGDRVSLYREGMELDELNECFKDKNASINDDGRIDASELEVQLLSDPTVLITEMPRDEERALEDATEEIWDQHNAPEFKWDD